MNDKSDYMRQSLVTFLEAGAHQLKNWIPTLRRIPLEQLHEDTGSRWGSVIGILSHVLRTDQIHYEILCGRPVDWVIKGTTENLEEIFETQKKVDDMFLQAVMEERDLGRPVRLWWGQPDHEFEVPAYQLVLQKIEHTVQHRGNVDSAIKRLGIELMSNSILELTLHKMSSPHVFSWKMP